MRLWSIHPKYLDIAGLLACWREGLLAKKVLEGKTVGYRNHSQLIRFKNYQNPIIAINGFLTQIYLEAKNRGYNFDLSKIVFSPDFQSKINVNSSQLEYEFNWLQSKLKIRNIEKFESNLNIKNIEANAIFQIIKGNIETWEKI